MNRFFTILVGIMLLPCAAFALEDGVYRDKAPGYGGDVIVTAIVKDGKITSLSTECAEKSEYYLKAEEVLVKAILEKQGVDGVDTVAGATGTSESILQAAAGIMEQARYTGMPAKPNLPQKDMDEVQITVDGADLSTPAG